MQSASNGARCVGHVLLLLLPDATYVIPRSDSGSVRLHPHLSDWGTVLGWGEGGEGMQLSIDCINSSHFDFAKSRSAVQ